MGDGDDTAGRLGHHGWLHGEPESPAFRDVELPPARWATLRSSFSPPDIRRRIAEAVERGAGGLLLSETRHGFVVQWTRGKKVLVAEITLAGWEEGTQIHLMVSKDTGATEKDVEALQKQLSRMVGEST
jgi:hypothetical protein